MLALFEAETIPLLNTVFEYRIHCAMCVSAFYSTHVLRKKLGQRANVQNSLRVCVPQCGISRRLEFSRMRAKNCGIRTLSGAKWARKKLSNAGDAAPLLAREKSCLSTPAENAGWRMKGCSNTHARALAPAAPVPRAFIPAETHFMGIRWRSPRKNKKSTGK